VTTLDDLSDFGVKVLYTQADVSIQKDRELLISRTKDFFGRLDLLVNNAGVAPVKRMDILDTEIESYDRVENINLKGPWFFTQTAANWMIEQKKSEPSFEGKIIFIGSVSSTLASVGRGEYCISKAGITMAAQLWAVRLGEYNFPVFEIRPGIIRTDMTAGVSGKYDDMIADGLLAQPRWGMPEDIGRAAVMLARGDLPYSTGQVIMVDGGMTLGRL
ncbi:MAG: 3-ketoacyl-ACP reductase, partial [Spirochaetales bacterium]|nr:3-ketoacyl-ACP reductase [Spirochaetales bacterium]